MTDRRGLLGGVCLAIGGLPLLLTYGLQSVGYFGLALVVLGAAIAYGATTV